MLVKTISLEESLSLETQGILTIYNPNTVSSPISLMNENDIWFKNWVLLRKQFRKIPIQKLPYFIDFDYRIEYKFFQENTISWVYMYGKSNVG
jgi:hypothetical protein